MRRVGVGLFAVGLLWLVYGIDLMLPAMDFRALGLVPRVPERWWGVATMPFLHGNLQHLMSNSVLLFVFTLLVLRHGVGRFLLASLFIIVLSGALVWSLARPALHIGASGWVFGLWALIIADGWYERSLAAVLTSLLVIVFYGGMIWSVLPANGISFEAHLAGLVTGVMYSALSHRSRSKRRRR